MLRKSDRRNVSGTGSQFRDYAIPHGLSFEYDAEVRGSSTPTMIGATVRETLTIGKPFSVICLSTGSIDAESIPAERLLDQWHSVCPIWYKKFMVFLEVVSASELKLQL